MPQSAILRIEGWLADHRPGYFARLRPGTTDDTLDAFEARFGVQLPAAFRAFYRWRDGQRADCSNRLQLNRMFMSLANITEPKEMLDGPLLLWNHPLTFALCLVLLAGEWVLRKARGWL